MREKERWVIGLGTQERKQERKEEGMGCTGFRIGSYYSFNEKQPDQIVRITDKPCMTVRAEIDGTEQILPRFVWKDGSESILVKDSNGYERAILSTQEVIA